MVSTDGSHLQAEGLSLSTIKGCIPVDTAAYDVPKKVQGVGPLLSSRNVEVFGSDEAGQRALSPISHIARDKGIPPFLILHVADRPDSRSQSKAFAKALRDAGVEANVLPATGKTHATINSDLGLPDDKPTRSVFEFLDELNRAVDHRRCRRISPPGSSARLSASMRRPARTRAGRYPTEPVLLRLLHARLRACAGLVRCRCRRDHPAALSAGGWGHQSAV